MAIYGLLRMTNSATNIFTDLQKAEEKAKRMVEQYDEDVGIFVLTATAKDPTPAIEIIPVVN